MPDNDKPLIWTSTASSDFISISDYLVSTWGLNSAISFEILVEDSLGLIQKFPEMHKFYDINKEIRKCVLNRHTSLYYRVEKRCIRILGLVSNRRNPKSIQFD